MTLTDYISLIARHSSLITFLLLLFSLTACTPAPVAPPPVELDLDQILAGNADQENWPNTVTGVWGDASATTRETTTTGYLLLLEGENGQVIGVSTTGDSIWTGRFLDSILSASYRHNGEISGNLRLRLSPDGQELSGDWTTVDGTRGTYAAYRASRISKETIIARIKESFGDRVTLVE